MIAFSTALSGIQAATARLNASASNVANMHGNGHTQRGAADARAAGRTPVAAYESVEVYQTAQQGGGTGTQVLRMQPASFSAYDPASPLADVDGMVTVPNVDPVAQRIAQMTALQSAQANIAVARVASRMTGSLFDIRV